MGYVCERVEFDKLALPEESISSIARFFSAEEACRIIEAAPEPYSTMFAVLAMTGSRKLVGCCRNRRIRRPLKLLAIAGEDLSCSDAPRLKPSIPSVTVGILSPSVIDPGSVWLTPD
jgi:hypothetical protein